MSLMHYLLEANLYLAAFYLLYVLLLRSETLYQLNRAYLLITSLLAFIIPLLQLGILKPEVKHLEKVGNISLGIEPVSVVVMPAQVVVQAPKWTTIDYVLAVYGAVTLVMLALLIIKFVKLITLSRKGKTEKRNGFVLVQIPGENMAFSFFGYLFVNAELSASQTIMQHEEVHIRQKHSWDVIYAELLKVFNWFNPAVYLLQKSLKEVHEFIADRQVAIAENGAEDYADFLIKNAYGLTQSQLTNSFFNKNLLKRRIMMLYQKRSGKAARLKYLVTLPLMGGLLCLSTLAFTTKNYGVIDLAPKVKITVGDDPADAAPKANDQSDYANGWRQAMRDMEAAHGNLVAKVNGGATTQTNPTSVQFPAPKTVRIKDIPGDPVFNAVEKNPTFPGGEEAFGKFLAGNIKYPAEAKTNGKSGRVFVQFIVEKDGTLSNLKLVRDPGYGMGAEAVRVISLSPKWNPGMQNGKLVRVMYTVPISFSLPNDDNKDAAASKNSDSVYNTAKINPIFPGGIAAFGRFLRDNIRYPKEAKEKSIQGRVFIGFIVEKDGTLSNMKVLRDPGTGLATEGLRVLSLSPRWTPGTNDNGEAVRVAYTVPINFSLVDDGGGNLNDLTKYIRDHVRYPKVAKEANIEGQSFVSFSINDQKQMQDMKVLKSPDQSISDEIIRVLRNFKTITDAKPGFTYILPVSMAIDHGEGVNKKTENTTAEIAKLYDKSNTIILGGVSVTAYGAVR